MILQKKRRYSFSKPHDSLPSFENEYLNIDGEEKRLGKQSPLITIILLSIGPLISQTVQALYGVVNLFWVSKTIGEKGIEVFGAVFIVDFFAMGISNYLMTALDIRISYLFGENKNTQECSQIYIDFLRVAVILGMIVPAIILPITRPVIEWFGSDKEISYMCLQYMIPPSAGCVVNFIYMISCGLIQSEGHSIVFGISQAASLIFNMGLFCPLFLVAFKLPIWGASLATLCSEGLVGLILTILIFMGKFTIRPSFRMFVRKFSPETWASLKIGIASLISSLADSLPSLLLQKYMNSAAKAIGAYDLVIQVWGVLEKLYMFVGGVNEAFSIGLMPSSAYAYGAKRYNRMLRLAFHATWIAILISIIYAAFMIFMPEKICSIWNKDPAFLDWCKKIIPPVFYLTPCFTIQYMVPALFQGMQKVTLSSILATVTVLLPMPLFATILYFTNKKSPEKIIWTYPFADGFSCTVCIIFAIIVLCKLRNSPKDEEIVKSTSIESLSSLRFAKSDGCSPTPLLSHYEVQ